jgi:ABC-type Fe3+/spermidine/putrescine transport system ATPase subunit
MSSRWVVEGLEAELDRFHLGPVHLELGPGNAIAVLGASGAGKTTLLRAIAGFLPTRRGRVLRDGVDVTDWPPEERSLGYVPQGLGLLPHRTVEGNVRYPMELRGRPDVVPRTRELLERFRLGPLSRRRPAQLSGGEQQRVALARTLAADPALIVWDEPWQGLDVLARYELGLVLNDLREVERVPIVLVTHDPSLAFSIADSFLVLDGGRVRDQCDAATLLRAPTDAFAARFVGFENVFDRAALSSGSAGSFRAWLMAKAGSQGAAFACPDLRPAAGSTPTWEAKVRCARPTPQGLTVEVVVDELLVTVRLPPPVTAPLPKFGDPFRMAVDPASVLSLGSPSPARSGS